MAISLFEHNAVAYRAACDMLSEEGKAAIVHPTGTGKSFIAFRFCEDHPDKRVCWVSPSAYIFQTQVENLMQSTGLQAPGNITFLTYAKLTLLSREELMEVRPDYIVLDEFHRCGAEEWGRATKALLGTYPKAPVLGLSATNIRYLDNQRDMAEELFDGNIASEISLGEAIVRGILPAPRYVISLYSYQQDLEKYERKVRAVKTRAARDAAQAYLEKLRRALTMADGLPAIFQKHMTNRAGKYIVFCSNLEHMVQMRDRVAEWFGAIDPTPHVYTAYSNDPKTAAAFQGFKADDSPHLKLLFTIDMLNEGVHVNNVDGVILFRPTVSPIIYKQQIGRALAAGQKTVPLILDVVNNFENLYSINCIEKEMLAAIEYYRCLGEESKIEVEHFGVIDELRDCRTLFDALEDTLQASWESMYRCAQEYYNAYGHLNVPKRYKTANGYSLGSWIMTQRRVYNGVVPGHLSEARVERLSAIGMVWSPASEVNWERNYNAAVKYYKQHGNLDVPASYVSDQGVSLGKWISNLRTWNKANVHQKYLTPERKKLLEEIGIIWSKFDYLWETNYYSACQYYKMHGNLIVPSNYVTREGLRLGKWIRRLRSRRATGDPKYGNLSEAQIQRLDEIGMVWGTQYEQAWLRHFQEAEKYAAQHGNLKVPAAYVTDSGDRLGRWVALQKERLRSGKLSQEQKQKLDALGMCWADTDPWELRYSLAKQYVEEHGSLKGMPGTYTVNGIWLNKWLNEQRQIYKGKRKGKTLTQEQIQKLTTLGFLLESGRAKARESVTKK